MPDYVRFLKTLRNILGFDPLSNHSYPEKVWNTESLQQFVNKNLLQNLTNSHFGADFSLENLTEGPKEFVIQWHRNAH